MIPGGNILSFALAALGLTLITGPRVMFVIEQSDWRDLASGTAVRGQLRRPAPLRNL
jgi:threonine/homoserine/homoserine lactone efflux protein